MIRWRCRRLPRLSVKARRACRVLCLGEDSTWGRVGIEGSPYFDINGVGFVTRMAQQMGPYYEFLNAAALNVTTQDYYEPEDPEHPGQPEYGGAYEMLVEPHLAAATGFPIDIALFFFWWTDAAEYISGKGHFEPAPVHVLRYLVTISDMIQRLSDAGVKEFLVLTPLQLDDPPLGWPKAAEYLSLYRIGIIDNVPALSLSVGYLDIYTLLDQDTYFPGGHWFTQAGHDLLAGVVAQHIRQNYPW